jgi:hypothetical protein
MGRCTHYLTVVYGVTCTKGFLKKKFNFVGDKDAEIDFFNDFDIKYLDARMRTYSFSKHSFTGSDNEKLAIGIEISDVDNVKDSDNSYSNDYINGIIEVSDNKLDELEKYDFFFEGFTTSNMRNRPRIISILSGCSCCT